LARSAPSTNDAEHRARPFIVRGSASVAETDDFAFRLVDPKFDAIQ
jgi:hypothetical protein